MPARRRIPYGTDASAPLWLMIPTGPSAGGSSVKSVEKPSTAPEWKLARPCEFGPTTRMPARRAWPSSSVWSRSPSAVPVSPNPDDMTTPPLTPMSAASATAPTAAGPGTAIRATSGTTGASSQRRHRRHALHHRAASGSPDTTSPAYPNSRM